MTPRTGKDASEMEEDDVLPPFVDPRQDSIAYAHR